MLRPETQIQRMIRESANIEDPFKQCPIVSIGTNHDIFFYLDPFQMMLENDIRDIMENYMEKLAYETLTNPSKRIKELYI